MKLHVEPGYENLAEIMQQALDQAQLGKGKKRHANKRPFQDQTLMNNIRAVGTGYSCGQAMKKAEELHSMVQRGEYGAAIEECYGAAVYLLATALYLHELDEDAGSCGDDTGKDRPWLDELVNWREAPSWAEWVAQDGDGLIRWHTGKNCELLKDKTWHSDYSTPYYDALHVARDWQTPLQRPKKICLGCKGNKGFFVFDAERERYVWVPCDVCHETGQVNAE